MEYPIECGRCGELFREGQEIAEVAMTAKDRCQFPHEGACVEGGESVVVHQECMKPGEEVA